MKTLVDRYFDWIVKLVSDGRHRNYSKLLATLFSIDFTYEIPMDGNRFEDGVDLRYRFCWETNGKQARVAKLLDSKPCSVLEMMAALALRCEEDFMSDQDIGNRTGRWFWEMIHSLGLSGMTDRYFNRRKVEHVIKKFLRHEYEPNGHGGLFTFEDAPGLDMRNEEIWCQMMWHLNDCIQKGE